MPGKTLLLFKYYQVLNIDRNLTLGVNNAAMLVTEIGSLSLMNLFVAVAVVLMMVDARFTGKSSCKEGRKAILKLTFPSSEHKCQYCCSVASWYCWGNVHFCDDCHTRQQKGDYVSKYEISRLPKCPGKNKCKLGIEHPPNGVPFTLGCSFCRNL